MSTVEQEIKERLEIPAEYDPDSDGGNLLGRLYDAADPVTQRHLFKRMAWALLNRLKERNMNTDEKIALLETRITQLEAAIANPASKPGLGPFQRMVYDDRGRGGIVVTVGGNNGGY